MFGTVLVSGALFWTPGAARRASAQVPIPIPPIGPNQPPPHLPNLTGTYRADDGGVYYVQQAGDVVWWAGMGLESSLAADLQWHRGLNFTNVFRGTFISANTISGDWADVVRGRTVNSGTLQLLVETSDDGPRLTKTAGTGGFGGTSWTETQPLDDLKVGDETMDIFARLDDVYKNDGSSIHDNLKPYRDQTVVYGRVTGRNLNDEEGPHLNYPDPGHQPRDFATFACDNPGGDGNMDQDLDMRLTIDLDRLEPDFYTTGWGNRDAGPTVFSLKFNDSHTRDTLGYTANQAYLGAEGLMYGREGRCIRIVNPPLVAPDEHGGRSLLPGWADLAGNSILVNGRPIDGSLPRVPPFPSCAFIQPCPLQPDNTGVMVGPAGGGFFNELSALVQLGPTYVRVTGTLILDCGHFSTSLDDWGHTCDDDLDAPGQTSRGQNQEIHPIYSIDIINAPFRPEDFRTPRLNHSLTGAWGGTDGSTYYIRQIGNTIWWLGLMRDRQPTMPLCPAPFSCGTNFPMIGTGQIAPAFQRNDPPCPSSPYECWAFANVFKGTITEFSDGSARIEGDWAGVPQSTSAGSTGGSMTFYVNANRKIIVPAAADVFPVRLDKLYEPAEDVTPPETDVQAGGPQYPAGAAQLFVTAATQVTVRASDAESGVQNVWYRSYARSAAPPAYVPAAGSAASFSLNGPDGPYEVDGRATDRDGNEDSANVRLVYLDDTPPQIAISQPRAAAYPHSAVLTLDYAASDGPGSGTHEITALLDDAASLDGLAIASGQTIDLLTALDLGSHTLTLSASDNLNNSRTQSVTFTIVATPDSIKDDVRQFLLSGAIRNAGLAASLLAKLDAAAGQWRAGNCAAATRIYQAVIGELQAQSGHGVDATAAQIMAADAQYLNARCP